MSIQKINNNHTNRWFEGQFGKLIVYLPFAKSSLRVSHFDSQVKRENDRIP